MLRQILSFIYTTQPPLPLREQGSSKPTLSLTLELLIRRKLISRLPPRLWYVYKPPPPLVLNL